WIFQPSTDLSDGTHKIEVTQTDKAGNESPKSPSLDITVDTTAPGAPQRAGGMDAAGPVTGSLVDGGVTDDKRPELFGSGATPGDIVTIYDNGTAIGSVVVDASGGWIFQPSTDLSEGTHKIEVTQTDKAGNESPKSPSLDVTVDTTAPVVAGIGAANDDQGLIRGPVADGGKTDDQRPTLSGSGEADTVITVYDGETVIGSTTVQPDGNWSFTPTSDLPEGPHGFTTKATDAAGNEGPLSPPYTVIIDKTGPDAVTIGGIADDEAPVEGAVAQNGTTNDTTPAITGSGAEAGGLVKIYDKGVLIGSVTADGSGNWSYTSDTLADGNHVFTARAVDAAGNEGALSSGWTIKVDTAVPGSPTLGSVRDDQGQVKGPLADGATTDDARPELRGSGAEAGAVITIYDGATAIGTAVAAANGTWSFLPAADLAEGDHHFTVTAKDAAGNESAPSEPFQVTVDTLAPSAPAIGVVTDNVDPVSGPLANGATTNDTTPAITGSGSEAGSLVRIYDNGVLVGSVTADGSGNWSFTPPVLGDGNHSFTARGVDASGNEGPASPAFDLTVDTTAPGAPQRAGGMDAAGPVTGALADGGVTDDKRPE
ncbi:hypothetical protein BTE77_35630, partial [Ensifer adhaerens]